MLAKSNNTNYPSCFFYSLFVRNAPDSGSTAAFFDLAPTFGNNKSSVPVSVSVSDPEPADDDGGSSDISAMS